MGLALLLALSACGGGGGAGGSPPPLASARTLAYAVSQCREDATRFVSHQELRIRRGEGGPMTVLGGTLEAVQEPPVLPGVCALYGTYRFGTGAVLAGGIQRIAVSPDGAGVVFERTNHFSFLGYPPLPPNEEGFFFVRADGSGMRPLGPASRESISRFVFGASYPNGLGTQIEGTPPSFSADGQTIVFTDRGPGPAGEDAAQVVTLDLVTGARSQVTHLPQPTLPPDPLGFDLWSVRFLPDGRIVFSTDADADGLHPQGGTFTIRPDGMDLPKEIPPPAVLPGSRIVENFQITGDQVTAFGLSLPGGAIEIFLSDRGNLLQLTNFGRSDTGNKTVDIDGQHVLFAASANPFDTNPSENCQIFSISTLGIDLRQLTDFSQGEHSTLGCNPPGGGGGPPPGCLIKDPRQDPVTRAVVFNSSCDPFGDNPNGEQVFAMYPDGTGLQQLTDMRGLTTEADGTVDVELPGPFASTAVRR